MAKDTMVKLMSGKVPVKDCVGRTIQFPVIGVASFDDKGVLSVSEDQLEEFLNYTKDSFNFYEPGKKKKYESKEDKLVGELSAQLDELPESDLLELVGATGDEGFKERAIYMNNDMVKAELVKRYKESLQPKEEVKE